MYSKKGIYTSLEVAGTGMFAMAKAVCRGGSPETSPGCPTLFMGVLEHTSPRSLGLFMTGAARGVSMYHGCTA